MYDDLLFEISKNFEEVFKKLLYKGGKTTLGDCADIASSFNIMEWKWTSIV